MFNNLIDEYAKNTMNSHLQDLEEYLQADVILFYGEIYEDIDSSFKEIVEQLQQDKKYKDKCYVILTTVGGSLNPVTRMVSTLRHFYSEVNFIVPDYAYSAGTIFCMSGDSILMNYYSVLGTVDPQVQTKDGKLVAALGYLDKINEMIKKSINDTLSPAEFLILKDFDLAELRAYEQAQEFAIDLIEKWLFKYKFKDWLHHSNGSPVTDEEKHDRAKKIASELSDNQIWKSHSRGISMNELMTMKLKIEDYSTDEELSKKIDAYFSIFREYITKYQINILIHTRSFL